MIVGTTLLLGTGSWAGTDPISYSYAWQRCDGNGNNCATISGAVGQSYVLITADAGHRLRGWVTARNALGSSSAHSKVTDVAQGPPRTIALPLISGVYRDGQTLQTTTGSWASVSAITYFFQWARCDAQGHCLPISRATARTYKLTAADVGRRLIVQVKAQNQIGPSWANSQPTPPIAAGTAPPPPPPPPPAPSGTTVPVSTVSLPDRLFIDHTRFSPRRITRRNQLLVVQVHIAEVAHGKSVSGALVYVTAVPFDRLSKAPEAVTAANGWATLTFRVLPTFTLRRGNLVVLFVRARKPGDSSLVGVSTRRLVSVPVG